MTSTLERNIADYLRTQSDRVEVTSTLDVIENDLVYLPRARRRQHPRRLAPLLTAASVAALVVGLTVVARGTAEPASTASDATSDAVGISPTEAAVPTPGITPVTIPSEFPSDVPRPDTFDLMTFITTNNEPVGWEFYDRREPTDSVERCTQYASSFDASWTSIPKTDVHPSIYAQAFDNGQWQVGIFCINDGGYLVQVLPVSLTPTTVPPPR